MTESESGREGAAAGFEAGLEARLVEKGPVESGPVESGPVEESDQPGRWGVVALLMLVSAGQQFQRVAIAALKPDIMAEFDIGETRMGVLDSVFLWTYTLLMMPGGLLADRIGTWGCLAIVMAGSTILGALTGCVGWLVSTGLALWWGIALCRGAMGVLSAPLYPSTARTVASWLAPGKRVLGNALVTGAALAGIAAAQQALPLISLRVGWRASFLIAGAVTGVITLLWLAVGRSGPWGRGPAPRAADGTGGGLPTRGPLSSLLRSAGGFLRHRGIVALTLSYAAVGYFEYLFFYWMSHFYEKVLLLPKEESGTYAMVPSLAMMVMTPLGGVACLWAVGRYGFRRGLRRTAMTAMTLAAVFLAVGALTDHLLWKTAWLALALGFIGASEGPFWTAAVHLGGSRGAACGGFVNTGGNLLGALAPIATPWIAAVAGALATDRGWAAPDDPRLGWTVALIAGSIVCLCGVCFWPWVDPDRRLD